ncbi:hypothetical protein AURDEDRAFT_174908 [Auricularia subglabra TFB-10046 SS5]|uniref:Uncharacterized protein n=1 Tax=Auricularia subglabra (strain TFB-10046 / SS5) TaxID=717982 RepID=J0WSE2_AURST|nr:hypothetical protein AURDEDRAFT_174908 [Auricularia subglabra TFB-10046 SS5]
MVNWRDPTTQVYCARAAAFVANLCTGIYLWEFIISLDFDWQLFAGRRPFRWTQAPYLVARYSYGVTMVILIIVSNLYVPIKDCKAWWIGFYVREKTGGLLGIELHGTDIHFHGAFVGIRPPGYPVAVAGCNPWHICFFALYWLGEAAIMIYGITLVEGAYVPELMSCAPTHTSRSERFAILTCLILYLICLALLARSLLRTRGLGLWRLLLSHGVVCFSVVILTFAFVTTFIFLDLNDGMNLIFEVLSAVSLVVCATRLYRGLVMYSASEPDAFISTGTTLAYGGNFPAVQQRTSDIILPRSFEGYSMTEGDRTPAIPCTPKVTTSDDALREDV